MKKSINAPPAGRWMAAVAPPSLIYYCSVETLGVPDFFFRSYTSVGDCVSMCVIALPKISWGQAGARGGEQTAELFITAPLVLRGDVINTWQFSFTSSFVIYWTNQSKAEHSKLPCDWLTKLRPGWRQVAVHWTANSWTCVHRVTECTAKHWAKQSVCTSLAEITVTYSVLIRSKIVRKGGALIFKF